MGRCCRGHQHPTPPVLGAEVEEAGDVWEGLVTGTEGSPGPSGTGSHPHTADALALVVGPVSCARGSETPWTRSPGAAGTHPLPGCDHHLRHCQMPRGRGQGTSPRPTRGPQSSDSGVLIGLQTPVFCHLKVA